MAGASANLLRHVHQLVETHKLGQLTDRQLLERFAAQRDEAAFALLVRRHGPMVFGLCRRVLGHEQAAEDAFQAAFLILARKAGSIRQTDVGGFLYRVAHRLAVRARGNAVKRDRRDQSAGAASASMDPTADVTWREVRAVVDEELQRLPEALRSAVVLCYLEGKTHEEAARLLG
jgi:RNA polymerase sigma factor (sigma-70 family)